MHLAVCDDNIADRKQMERLLGRESDRRQNTTGVLYVDSFGNRDAILTTPMIYDGLFIDMTEDGSDAVEIAGKLREAGSILPIVFCLLQDRLPEVAVPSGQLLFPGQARSSCRACRHVRPAPCHQKKSQVKRYEFRSLTETFYLEEKDIMYAWPVDDQTVRIRLTDGSEKNIRIHSLKFLRQPGLRCGQLQPGHRQSGYRLHPRQPVRASGHDRLLLCRKPEARGKDRIFST